MKLSDQAIATLMITLQKCILEQTDITEILKNYDLKMDNQTESLIIINPPTSMIISSQEDS